MPTWPGTEVGPFFNVPLFPFPEASDAVPLSKRQYPIKLFGRIEEGGSEAVVVGVGAGGGMIVGVVTGVGAGAGLNTGAGVGVVVTGDAAVIFNVKAVLCDRPPDTAVTVMG